MANPQRENGHLDIANEIVTQLAKINLSSYESRVLWAIWRKTWCWHKKIDRISISQISKMTNLNRGHTWRALNSLLQKQILIKDNRYKTLHLGFQKNYDRWSVPVEEQQGVPVEEQQGVPVQEQSVPVEATKLTPVQEHTKEKKETIKKKNIVEDQKPNPQAKKSLSYFGEKYKAFTKGITYHANFKKETTLFKKALQTMSEAQLYDLIDIFFENAEAGDWVADKVDVGVFYSQINKLQLKLAKEKEMRR